MDDLKELFDEHNVEYWTKGENVSRGWINVQCPFPGCDDDWNHCGIRIKDFKVNCWKCGKHNFPKLISLLTGMPYAEAKHLKSSLSRAGGDEYYNPPLNAGVVLAQYVNLPPESTRRFPKGHLEYLRDRGFTPRKTIRKYKLRAVHTIGEYKFRIIIPIVMDGELVSFTSRDITDQQDPPYKHLQKDKSIIHPKNALYNYDTVTPNSDALLVEGPIDAWKMGDGALGTFGVELTPMQLIYIKRKKIRTLFLFFDPDKAGRKASRYFSNILAPLVQTLEIVTLEKISDPGELTLAEAESIKYELGFNR